MILNKTMQALADPTRLKILEILKDKDSAVFDIAKNFSITPPSLSHHLSILKQADLITFRREGQNLIYSLNLSVFEETAKILLKFFNRKK